MSEIYGYARVSTDEQTTALQVDALKAAGVPRENLVEECISGAAPHRPLFTELLDQLQPGDTLMVWKVDRLGRSTVDALQTAERLNKAGIRIVITTLGVDLSTPAGKLVFGILSQIAEFERDLIRERTKAGMASARARGRRPGPRNALTPHQRAEAARLAAEGKSLGEIAALFRVGKSIVFRAVQAARATELRDAA